MPQNSKRSEQEEEALIEALCDFCYQHARWFAKWPRATLRDYFLFHALQNTMVFLRNSEGAIIAFATGWQCWESEVQRPEFVRQPWSWQSTDPTGDAFFVCDLICTEPAAVPALIAELEWRFPAWRRLKFFCIRRGHLKFFPAERMLRRVEAQFFNHNPERKK